uniref:Protein rogdi homolog n=3 Tax=Canis lupus TaxID=9612 RepID=A0A8I3PDH0_CANLF
GGCGAPRTARRRVAATAPRRRQLDPGRPLGRSAAGEGLGPDAAGALTAGGPRLGRAAGGGDGGGDGSDGGRAGGAGEARGRAAGAPGGGGRLTAGLSPQEEEFRWLLHDEVHAVLRQLQDILKEASLRFTLPSSGTATEGPAKQENFILGSCSTDQVKGVLTLQGDALSQADVNLKIPRNNQLLHFAFREDKQWKLQQIQDARNHVSQAMYLLANRDESYQFRTGAEVLKLMDAVMLQLTRARNRLTTPATLTLPEIAASGLTRMFAPALPSDLLVNVYINLNKLCLTVYQLHALQPNSTKNFRPAGGAVLHSPGAMFEWGSQRLEVSHVHKVECVIPWLNDALVFFTVSLQLCQQLKDKISVFSSYWSYRPF